MLAIFPSAFMDTSNWAVTASSHQFSSPSSHAILLLAYSIPEGCHRLLPTTCRTSMEIMVDWDLMSTAAPTGTPSVSVSSITLLSRHWIASAHGRVYIDEMNLPASLRWSPQVTGALSCRNTVSSGPTLCLSYQWLATCLSKMTHFPSIMTGFPLVVFVCSCWAWWRLSRRRRVPFRFVVVLMTLWMLVNNVLLIIDIHPRFERNRIGCIYSVQVTVMTSKIRISPLKPIQVL